MTHCLAKPVPNCRTPTRKRFKVNQARHLQPKPSDRPVWYRMCTRPLEPLEHRERTVQYTMPVSLWERLGALLAYNAALQGHVYLWASWKPQGFHKGLMPVLSCKTAGLIGGRRPRTMLRLVVTPTLRAAEMFWVKMPQGVEFTPALVRDRRTVSK